MEFLRSYIGRNESSPRLEDIAEHFKVTAPTVHNHLKALQEKGLLYFGRSSHSGFFIRLIERAGTSELVTEIPITGKVDKYGEVYDFPKLHGHFASVLAGATPGDLFGVVLFGEIPQENMSVGDLIIFDTNKKPQQNDICIFQIGEGRLFLGRVVTKTYSDEILSDVMASEYPIPEGLPEDERKQYLNWHPIAYDNETEDYYIEVAREAGWGEGPYPDDLVLATALRLSRMLTPGN